MKSAVLDLDFDIDIDPFDWSMVAPHSTDAGTIDAGPLNRWTPCNTGMTSASSAMSRLAAIPQWIRIDYHVRTAGLLDGRAPCRHRYTAASPGLI